jgi:hypothetical protein
MKDFNPSWFKDKTSLRYFMLIAKARTARPTLIRRGHSVNGALSIIKPSFCGFREQCVTSVM